MKIWLCKILDIYHVWVRDCNVESVNENVAKIDESDDDTVTRKVFSPHNLGTPGSPGVKGPSS